MGYDLNNVSFTGRLGKDPEMRYLPSGDAVTKFPVAVGVGDDTIWFDVEVWGKAAESCNQYLRKGSRIAVNGSLRQDKWESDDGRTHSKLVIKAAFGGTVFLDSKGSQSDSGGESSPPPQLGDDSGSIDDLL